MGRSIVTHIDDARWVRGGPEGQGDYPDGGGQLIGDLVEGPWNHVNWLPAGLVAPPHHHDHDEVMVILQGGFTMGERECGPGTVVYIESGTSYGFTVSNEGVRFLNVRQGLATIHMHGETTNPYEASHTGIDGASAVGPNDAAEEMSVFDAIHVLRAVRCYDDRDIAPADLDRILRSATMACSSGNTQPWEFVVVRDAEVKRRIKEQMVDAFSTIDAERAQKPEALIDASGRPVTGHASVESLDRVPVIVVVCWNPDRGIRMKNEYAENPDGTLRETRSIPGGRGSSLFPACQNLMLAAQALGISSLFTTFFGLRDKEIKEILGIPPRVFMECAVYLGYSSETLGRPRRKPIEEVVHADRFGNAYQPVTRLSG